MACENARSESEWSLGRPAASPTCKGHQREGRRGCTRSRRQGGHGGGTGSGGVEQSGQRAQRGGGRRGAESAEGRVCRGGGCSARRECRGYSGRTHTVQRVQRLQRAPSTHVEALAQLRPYTAVGLLHQVLPRACGRLAEAVLGRGAQHKHRHARCLGPGAKRVQRGCRARTERVQSACRACSRVRAERCRAHAGSRAPWRSP